MFFVLSKTLGYLVQPFTLVCVLFTAYAFWPQTQLRKKLFWTAFTMLLFFSNEFIANEVMKAWEVDPVLFKDVKPHRLGIVLTGATSANLPDDRVHFHRGADRVVHTVQLYKSGLIEKILISGGSGRLMMEEEPEANKFKKAMMLMGIPDSVILIENETRNTAESAIEVKKLLEQFGYRAEDCLLITSAFHMRRSLACYRKAGVDLDAFSTDFYGNYREYYFDSFVIPHKDALEKWHKLCKEWVGMVAYKMAGYI